MTHAMHGVMLFMSLLHTFFLLAAGGVAFWLLRLNIFKIPVALSWRIAHILHILWVAVAVMPIFYCLAAWQTGTTTDDHPSAPVALLAFLASPGFAAVAAALILAAGLLFALRGNFAWSSAEKARN
ncbi:hypothetical protein ACMGGR_09465 [Erwinia sp. BNK-24-b]|uniref:hypothetical protein n=1 Tax=unclassified Erwinia TaxID=2622719 RepID=UPI0039BEE846